MDRKLLEILCCPVTKQLLQPLSRDRLRKLNERIGTGEVRYLDGSLVQAPLKEALITANGERIYMVEDGIPLMLEERAISVRSAGLG